MSKISAKKKNVDDDDVPIDTRSDVIGLTLMVLVLATVVVLVWSLLVSNQWIHRLGGKPNEYLNQSQYNLCTRVDHPPNTTNITIDHHCNYLFPLVHCETLFSSSTDDYCFITCALSYGLFWSYLVFLFMSGHCPRLFMYCRHSRYRMVADIPPSIIEKFGFISLIFAIGVGIMSNITFNWHIYLNLSYGSGLIGLNISQLIAFLTSIVLAYWLGSHASRRSSFIINE